MILLDSDIRRALSDRSARISKAYAERRQALRSSQRGFVLNPYAYSAGGGGGLGTKVKLLLHGNGTNGGTTFTDDSTFGHTMTAVGGVNTSSAQVKYGSAALAFDSVDDRLTLSSSNIVIGTQDFFMECWTWGATNSFTRNAGVFQLSSNAGGLTTSNSNNIALFYGTGGVFQYIRNGSQSASSSGKTANTYNHVAIGRQGTTTRLFVMGAVEQTTAGDATNYTGQELCIGGYYNTSFLLSGYVDDFRLVVGDPVYTSGFTPPGAELANP